MRMQNERVFLLCVILERDEGIIHTATAKKQFYDIETTRN